MWSTKHVFGYFMLPMSKVRCVTHVSGLEPKIVARSGRFERPTLCFGGTRSIQLSYERAEQTTLHIVTRKRVGLRERPGDASQPLARSLICRASFSISSAFLTKARESVVVESVFSTCAFNCEAKSNSFSTFFLMSF